MDSDSSNCKYLSIALPAQRTSICGDQPQLALQLVPLQVQARRLVEVALPVPLQLGLTRVGGLASARGH